MMGSASNTFCLLILLISINFHFSRSQVMEVVSGHDNVDAEMGSAFLTGFRFLLGLQRSRPQRHAHSFSPAPALAPALAPAPAMHAHALHRPPFLHKLHNNQPPHRSKSPIIIVVVAVVGSILAASFAVAVFVACKRSRRMRMQSSASTATNKVSYDPGPELFYLNSLAPILDLESSDKYSSQSKNVWLNDSIASSNNPSHNEQQRETESEIISANANIDATQSTCIESVSSDDESFHSICNSHSSVEVASVVSESNLSCLSGNCSPCSSSTGSSSPTCKITYFPTMLKQQGPNSPHISHSEPLRSYMNHSLNQQPISESIIRRPQPSPIPLVSNVNIPKPPPPPRPPNAASSSRNGCYSGQAPPLPPRQPPQSMPIGKDGTPLPKLKPLHWDKVRAAPDGSMVWDKIRSSSFE